MLNPIAPGFTRLPKTRTRLPTIRSGVISLIALWLAVLLLSCPANLAQAGTLSEHILTARSYPGSRDRQYKVYVPDNLPNPAPLVMVLHGCAQTHEDVLRDWGMQAAADRYHFILVAPYVTSWDLWDGIRGDNCWGFWLPQHRQAGRGEPEDLYQIALEVERGHPVDPQKRYVTGLSSGGAMSVILTVTHNDYWAAAAPAAGLPYGEDAKAVSALGTCPGWAWFHSLPRVVSDMRAQLGASAYPLPLLVIQNTQDCTVLQPAGANLRDAQLALYADPAHRTPNKAWIEEVACAPVFQEDYGCRHSRYSRDGQSGGPSLVETLSYQGPHLTPSHEDRDLGHYWVGGVEGQEGPYAVRRGPSYPDIIWDFFERHRRGDAGQVNFDDQPLSCVSRTYSPWNHLNAGRGFLSTLGGQVLSSGDRKSIGFSWDWWSKVTLHEGASGLWYTETPARCR